MPGAVSTGRLRGPEAQRGLMPDTGLSRGYIRFRNYRASRVPSMHSRKWESAAVCAAWGGPRERSAAVGSVADAGPAVSAAAALRPTAIRPAALPARAAAVRPAGPGPHKPPPRKGQSPIPTRRTLLAALPVAFLLPAAITAAMTSASSPFRDTREPDIKNSRPHNANTPGPVAFRSYSSSRRAMLRNLAAYR